VDGHQVTATAQPTEVGVGDVSDGHRAAEHEEVTVWCQLVDRVHHTAAGGGRIGEGQHKL